MATLQTKAIQPSTGSNVNLGTTGDAVLLSSDSIKTNLYKDSGGNTLFQSDGAGTLSNINSALENTGPKLISTTNVSSAVATIDITSGLDSTYNHYQFVFVNIAPATNNVGWLFQMGSSYNTSMATVAFYVQHFESGATSGPELTNAAGRQGNGTAFQVLNENVEAAADASLSGELHLFSPSSTTYIKTFMTRIHDSDYQPTAQTRFVSGYFNTTTALTQIRFKFSSGNIVSGKIKLYGIS
tara:strand:- start:1088 stop:1810 length:723 start_codon:yes stop_codon:yes gene_type:complete